MKWLGSMAALAISLSACSGSSTSFSDGCVAKVSHKSHVYVEVGFSNRRVTPDGEVTIADCAADPHAKTVDAVTFSGYKSVDVVAVREHGDVYRVFVAEDLGDAYIKSLHDAHLLNAGDD